MLSHIYNGVHLIKLYRSQGINCARFLSSAGKEKTVMKDSGHSTSLGSSDTFLVEPERIKSFNISKNIETLHKPGSIFYNYFLGVYDKDILRTRKEFLEMSNQYEMIRNTWKMVKTKDNNLDVLGYRSLQNLSVTEMMFIFEAIGAGEEKLLPFGDKEDKEFRFEKKVHKAFNIDKIRSNNSTIMEGISKSIDNLRSTLDILIPLISNNSIIYRAIEQSSNEQLKNLVLNSNLKIGLALNEDILNIPNLSRDLFWKSSASLSYQSDYWLLSGEKSNIIKGNYDYYLVFAHTKNFLNQQAYSDSKDNRQGFMTILVPSDRVQVIDTKSTPYGVSYQKIEFDNVQIDRNQFEVTKPTQDYKQLANLIGCGKLATSAFILGLMKQMLRNTYACLINERVGILNTEIVQLKLYKVTCKVYSIESMLYLTAAMFDSFDSDSNLDAECRTVKTMTIDYAYDIVKDMRSIFGSRYPASSSLLELIHQLDSFLENTNENRISIGESAVKNYLLHNTFGSNKITASIRAPIYSIKEYLNYRKLRKGALFVDKDMTKYIHHNLHVVCNWICDSIYKLEFSSEFLVNLHKEKVMEKQMDLDRLTAMAMNIHIMISVLSRANQALCYGRRNNHAEKEICIAICKDIFLDQLRIFEEINRETMTDNDLFVMNIHKVNQKEKGYFPSMFEIEDN